MSPIGYFLREMARTQGKRQKDVAQAAGVSAATISKMMGAKSNPRFSSLCSVSHALGLPPSELMRLYELTSAGWKPEGDDRKNKLRLTEKLCRVLRSER